MFAGVDWLSLPSKFGVASIAVELELNRGEGCCDNDRGEGFNDAVDGFDGAAAVSSAPVTMKRIKGELLADCPSKGR